MNQEVGYYAGWFIIVKCFEADRVITGVAPTMPDEVARICNCDAVAKIPFVSCSPARDASHEAQWNANDCLASCLQINSQRPNEITQHRFVTANCRWIVPRLAIQVSAQDRACAARCSTR